jgi:pimeloyl-ACP methyl ester carboxylesterase
MGEGRIDRTASGDGGMIGRTRGEGPRGSGGQNRRSVGRTALLAAVAAAGLALLACGTPRSAAIEVAMPDTLIHRAVSPDGTEIAGRAHGSGPPLVLVPGGLGDGESSWDPLLPHLAGSFTLYLMSPRGLGLSAEPAEGDYALDRLVENIVAFTEAIGEPTGLLGYSLGGALALGAAARSDAVAAVAVYEPSIFEVPSPVDPRASEERATRMAEAVAAGRLADAARIMIGDVATEEELAALSAGSHFDAIGRNVPVALRVVEQAGRSTGPSPTDPSALGRVTAPVLYLHGSRTPTTWYTDAARHLEAHLPAIRVVEIAGAGHFAPHLAPDAIAGELVRFFARRRSPPAGSKPWMRTEASRLHSPAPPFGSSASLGGLRERADEAEGFRGEASWSVKSPGPRHDRSQHGGSGAGAVPGAPHRKHETSSCKRGHALTSSVACICKECARQDSNL